MENVKNDLCVGSLIFVGRRGTKMGVGGERDETPVVQLSVCCRPFGPRVSWFPETGTKMLVFFSFKCWCQ